MSTQAGSMRFFSLGRKLPQLSLAECHAHLAERHGPLVRGCRGFRDHCRHYRQNHIQGDVDLAAGALRTQADPAFHYCSAFWYEDADALIRAYRDTDYARVLRPDTQLWADASARLAFMADEAWSTGLAQPPEGSGRTKLLVLHRRAAGDDGLAGARGPQRFPGFFEPCLRATYNVVSGQLDHARAAIREEVDLPFQAVSELWFDSPDAARQALGGDDGRRLVEQAGWLPAQADQGTVLWATERVVF